MTEQSTKRPPIRGLLWLPDGCESLDSYDWTEVSASEQSEPRNAWKFSLLAGPLGGYEQ